MASQPMQPQGLTQTTPVSHQALAGASPEQRQSRKWVAVGIEQPAQPSQLARNQLITGMGGRQYRKIARATESPAGGRVGTSRHSGGRASSRALPCGGIARGPGSQIRSQP
jgi:hypothetical protein